MENIFNEFEHWWDLEIRRQPSVRLPSRMIFTEARGTNYEEFNNIVTKIYERLKEYEGVPYLKDNNVYSYFTLNPISLNDCFIKDITVTTYPSNSNDYLANGASFDYDKLKYDSELDKCTNCYIGIFGNSSQSIDFKHIDILSYLWHEIQHIYRQYCILRQEYIKGKPNTKANFSNRFNTNALNYYGNNIVEFISELCYLIDKDEIDARMQELIPYLQRHKEINSSNYKRSLKDFTSYQLILDLKNMKFYFQINILASDEIEKIGKFIKQMYTDANYYSTAKVSPIKSAYCLYYRLCRAIIYAQNQFYKILFYTLQKLGRNLNEGVRYELRKRFGFKPITEEDKIIFKKDLDYFKKISKLYEQQFE